MTSSASSIEELNNVIKSQNPFNRGVVVRKQDVWGKGFPDVSSLNAHASDSVFEAIKQVRQGQRQAVGITIKAEKGLGKSHIISRIRHRLQAEGGALFVYMTDYDNLNRIKPEFLKTLALSLKQVGSQNVMQWQELATALANEAKGTNYTPAQVVNSFPQMLARNPRLVDKLTEKVLAVKPDIDNPYLIQAILWTLSQQHAHFAVNWLTGKSLAQSTADTMGLPNSTEEEKDAEAFERVCQILDLISNYSTLVICFDELDNPECNEAGFTRAQVAAGLAKDLYNSIKRGVLLTAIFPEIWTHQIKTLPYAESVIDRIGEKVLELTYLNSDDVVGLVSQWLKEFYDDKCLTPIHPVYPFDEGKLREFGKEKPIVRRVLQWCQEHWTIPNSTIEPLPPPQHPVELAFKNEMGNVEGGELIDNKAKVAKALTFGFERLIGQTVERVTIQTIENSVTPKSQNKGFIDFKLIGLEDSRTVKIGVAIIQDSVGIGVQAGLSRLVDYKKYDLTRGCLVRSKTISPNAKKAQECLKQLLEKQGGEWVLLKEEEVKPLIAIRSVYDARQDYELSEEQIFEFISNQKLVVDNSLIREILSNPSGQVPEDAVDEEIALDIPHLTATSDSPDIKSEVDLESIEELPSQTDVKAQDGASLPSETRLITLELHQQGFTATEIAQKRNLSLTTIIGHLTELIENNQPVNIDLLVSPERHAKIQQAIQAVGSKSLKSIRNNLGDSYTYDEIKLIRAWLCKENHS